MSNIQIEVDGVVTNLRNKTDLLKVIGDMNKACASKVKSGAVKTNAKKQAELATLSFFGSIAHYLQGGMEP